MDADPPKLEGGCFGGVAIYHNLPIVIGKDSVGCLGAVQGNPGFLQINN